jgi:hypothetical protein
MVSNDSATASKAFASASREFVTYPVVVRLIKMLLRLFQVTERRQQVILRTLIGAFLSTSVHDRDQKAL